ncbi:MAG: valine--tRNA ligase [Defluviitaleaceae bacterium]|nr:valine--tRNA ligase [Defluviitaleaceae bacterium]
MRKELDTRYDPKAVEDRLYAHWVKQKYFHAVADETKTPYTIMMPPPNVTGQLHLGHALNLTLQDILIRWKKMQGFNTLWMPGTDHAAIATEVKIVEKMAAEGIKKVDIGREGFMERAWAWYDDVGGVISNQFRKLGVAADWDRERFTMDEGLSDAVLEVFVRLHEKGLIYRGERLVNWCTHCKTSISDAEVEHEDQKGGFWHFKYPVKDMPGTYVEFATTRPETMLGDTAIAVNPNDERYQHLIGKTAVMPILGREIPIIADDYVKTDFGTGMVKITPAHDFNDFEIGVRHNLPKINIMNDDGTINENGGKYAGMDRYEAREAIVLDMDMRNLFVKKEVLENSIGGHDRCRTVVEPLMKLQWFVKMEGLAKPAIDAYKNDELRIVPERFGKVYLHWLENIRDWCISRQLWWGHRIPAYYCACGEVTVAKAAPDACSKCGAVELKQDEDSLDTWFSSALWPFSTLGWPEQTPELAHFYPTNVLVTAYEILFFWVVRMVFSGIEFMGQLPFKDVFIHGIMRDEQGRKMSKSLGNGIDPLEAIENYGADALRFSLTTGNAPGNDLRFYIEKVEASRNFLNKIWNAARFIMMNLGDAEPTAEIDDLTAADRWIIAKANRVAAEVTQNLDNYELGVAADKVYTFMWDEFCDWYIEMAKPRLYNEADTTRDAALWTLRHVLISGLKMLHPFIPFITEEIFTTVGGGDTIMTAQWPVFAAEHDFAAEEAEVEQIKEAIRAMRNLRSNMNVPPSRRAKVFVVSESCEVRGIYERGAKYIMALASAAEVTVQADRDGIEANAVSIVVPGAEIFMPFADLVDIEKEKERLAKEVAKLEQEVGRVTAKLNNPGFVGKAPASIIEEERAKEAKYGEMLAAVREQLKAIGG